MPVEDQGDPPKSPVKKSAPRKQPRLNFEEFIANVQSVVNGSNKRSVALVFLLIKRGFAGEVNSEQAQRTIELLRGWSEVDRLAVRLAVENRTRKLRAFSRQVAAGLRLGFVRSLGYPLQTQAGSESYSSVISWLEKSTKIETGGFDQAKGLPDQLQDEKQKQVVSDKELRMKFVCLLGESNDSLVYEALYRLLGVFSKKKKKKLTTLLPGQEFIKLVGSAFASSRIKSSTVENILKASAPMVDVVASQQEQLSVVMRRFESAQRRIALLEENELALNEMLRKSKEQVVQLNALALEKDEAIANWVERYEALDKHWKEVVKEKLARQAGDLKKRITHEVNEAKLSLGGSQPDTRMASDRLTQIQEILQGPD